MSTIGFKEMFLDGVIGRRKIIIRLPPASLAKSIFLEPILIHIFDISLQYGYFFMHYADNG
jgi:hypothetical protein